MAASIYDWSTTAGDNATADSSINWAEGQLPSTVNGSARQMMGRLAEWLIDNGAITATGTNTISFSAGSGFSAYATGHALTFKAAGTNTTAVTLNVNAIGAKTVRVVDQNGERTLFPGEMVSGGIYTVRYDEAAASAAGAWILLNPSSPLTFKTAGTYVGIGTASPESNLHIVSAAVGSFTPDSRSDIVIEDVNSFVELAGDGTSGQVGILFSDATNAVGSLVYDHASNELRVTVGATRIWTMTASAAYFGKQSASLNVAGVEMQTAGLCRFTVDAGPSIDQNRTTSDGQITRYFRGGSQVGSVSVTGSATAYNTSSDGRAKTNRRPLDDAGEIIDALEPLRYDWRHVAGSGVGFIAQDLARHVPEAVSKGDENPDLLPGDDGFEWWEVDPSKLLPYLVAAVKELRARVAAIE